MSSRLKWTPARRAQILEALRAGRSQEDACVEAGVGYETFKGWIRRGKSETGTDHADFADRVKGALGEATEAIGDRDELIRLLWKSARNGSVRAVLELLKREEENPGHDAARGAEKETPEEPKDEFDRLDDDELEPRRKAKARGA